MGSDTTLRRRLHTLHLAAGVVLLTLLIVLWFILPRVFPDVREYTLLMALAPFLGLIVLATLVSTIWMTARLKGSKKREVILIVLLVAAVFIPVVGILVYVGVAFASVAALRPRTPDI